MFSTDIASDDAEIEVADTLLLEDVSFDYANLLNRGHKGALVVPGDTLLLIECSSASAVGLLANRLEADNSQIRLVNIDTRSGQLTLKGSLTCLQRIDAELTRVSAET